METRVAAERLPQMTLDYVKIYSSVIDFKDSISKIFSNEGLVRESARLDGFETAAMKAPLDDAIGAQQLSASVVHLFHLIAELVHAVVTSKERVRTAAVTADRASQTDVADTNTQTDHADSTVVPRPSTRPAASIKHEKETNSCDDITTPPATISTQVDPASIPSPAPLRKSSRSSVLNRKPFVTPRRAKAPAKVTGAKAVAIKVTGVKAVGAKKRKQGEVRKRLVRPVRKKKAAKSVVAMETEVKTEATEEEDREWKPRRSKLATNLYEKTPEGRFRCKECGKEAKLQTNIRKHLRKHTGEKPYRCSKCPAAFAYPRSLKRHELVHEGVRPYKCPQCDKSFFDPTSLRTHSRVHTDDRPYVCQICGNRFRQNEGLKGHMRSHTGDRPYVCERCGMAFAAKRSLIRHIRVHTGERPYSCDQCVAAFADWTTLHNHKLVHRTPGTTDRVGGEGEGREGEDKDAGVENKPYQCQFCGVRYRQPLSLKRHLRLHSTNAVPHKPAPKKPRKRKGEEGEDDQGEERAALHLQYRPYQCEECGERFKHLRGYHTHKNKHLSGALDGKKAASKRVKHSGVGELSKQDIEQAATILASVAVNSTAYPPPPHTTTTTATAGNLTAAVLNPPPSSNATTVTIIDPATFNSLAAVDPPPIHLPVSAGGVVGAGTGDLIQYTPGNVTQVIQYPDGTLSEVTTLVPHPPPPSIIQPTDLLDNVVTVVFETRDGNVVVENPSGV